MSKQRVLGILAKAVILLGLAVFLPMASPRAEAGPPPTAAPITMDELHRFGGAPPGWRFALPPGDAAAGRQAFVELGCYSCHSVKGEAFPDPEEGTRRSGPDLSGMGSHHPPEYFAESILNPNAVRIQGPGYLGSDGSSTMPSYPSMTVGQLANLVAYLGSLKGTEKGGTPHCAAVSGNAAVFFIQAFEITGEKLDTFYDWFERQHYRDCAGLVSIQTFAGRREKNNVVVAQFGFESEAALKQFTAQLDGQPKNTFVRPSDRYILRSPALYRVDGMSTR